MTESVLEVMQPHQRLDRAIREGSHDTQGLPFRYSFGEKPIEHDRFLECEWTRDAKARHGIVGRHRRERRLRGRLPRIVPPPDAAIDPSRDGFNLFLRQAQIVPKAAKTLHRAPGRHAAGEHRVLDVVRTRLDVLIRHQREGAAARMVARGTALIDQPRDLAVPGGRSPDAMGLDDEAARRERDDRTQYWSHRVTRRARSPLTGAALRSTRY